MDILDFVQGICSWSLSGYQVKFIRAVYDALKNDKALVYIPSRGSSRFEYSTLQALCILFVAYERGMIKKNSVKEKTND